MLLHYSLTSSIAYLDDTSLVHGYAVVRILRELMECTSSRTVNLWVWGLQIAHQGSHCSCLTKRHTVVTPHATPGINVWTSKRTLLEVSDRNMVHLLQTFYSSDAAT